VDFAFAFEFEIETKLTTIHSFHLFIGWLNDEKVNVGWLGSSCNCNCNSEKRERKLYNYLIRFDLQ
jgi:hypothetical protein